MTETGTERFYLVFFCVLGDRKWSLLPGYILNLNPKSVGDGKSPYRTFPTMEPDVLAIFSSQIQDTVEKDKYFHRRLSMSR